MIAGLGKELVNRFHVLLKTAQIHDSTNVALDAPLENLMKIIHQIHAEQEEAVLRVGSHALFLGDMKLKMDIEGFISFSFVIEELEKRKVGTIVFTPSVGERDLKRFVYLFLAVDPKESSPCDVLSGRLRDAGLGTIVIEKLEKEREEIGDTIKDKKEMALRTYQRVTEVTQEVMSDAKVGRTLNFSKSKRVIQSMVAQLLEDETILLGLTTLRCHDEYTHNHSVNVCILGLAIGQRLGYDRRMLPELGMASLFHDIGKAEIPVSVLNKPAEFEEEDWQIIRKHPVLGVKTLLRLKGMTESSHRVMLGSFEHHLNYDLTGYPRLARKRILTLIGRIVSIVDCYDALTSSRVYNRIPYPPDKALRFMLSKSGKAFDPVLLKIFINCIGIYPIGSLVLLDTKELGVVVQANPNPTRGDRPKVRLLTDPSGNEVTGEVVDLVEEVPGGGRPLRSIVKTIDPTRYHLDVSRYFV